MHKNNNMMLIFNRKKGNVGPKKAWKLPNIHRRLDPEIS